jgi:hypothetical protein
MTDLQQQIRFVLSRYLDGTIPFEAFEDWFVDATWDVKRLNPNAADLVYAIEACLFDYTSHRKSERALKASLRSFAPKWTWRELALSIPVAPVGPPAPRKATKRATSVLVVAAGT